MEHLRAVGPFDVGSLIGSGGMSDVYEAIHRASGQRVALKVTRFGPGDSARRSAFSAEIAAMARMDHTAIVRIHDWGTLPDGTGNWCAMEWAPDGALIPASIRSWPQLESVLRSVLQALAHAHARGVIHRDLKPANILCFEDPNRYRLADFGLAHSQIVHGNRAKTGEVSGTPAYMAPEQLHGFWREYGPWTDLYALGCVAFHLASGDIPFRGDSPLAIAMAHLSDPRPQLTPRFGVPDGFEGWLGGLLSSDWTARPRTASTALWELEQLGPAPEIESSISPDAATAPIMAFNPTLVAETLLDQGFVPETPRGRAAGREYPPVPIPNDWRETTPTSTPFGDSGSKLISLRETALVGHERLRDSIWSEFRRVVMESQPRCVIIEGEPIAERERVVSWFCRRVREVSAVPVFSFDASLERVGEDPFLDAAAETFATRGLTGTRLREHLSRFVAMYLGDEPIFIQRIAELSETSGVESRLGARATFWEFLELLSKRTPMVIVVTGLARDRAPWLLLERFLRKSGVPAMLIASTSNSEWSSTDAERFVRDHPNTTFERPDKLSKAQAVYAIESYVRLAPELRDSWAELVEESITFAFDVLRQGASLGALIPSDEGYRLRSTLSIPRTVEQATRMRMNVLMRQSTTAMRALAVAATLGRYVGLQEWNEAMNLLNAELAVNDIDVVLRHEFLKPLRTGYQFRSQEERRAVAAYLSLDDARALLGATKDKSPRWALLESELYERVGDLDRAVQTLIDTDLEALGDSGSLADRWFERARELQASLPKPNDELAVWTILADLRFLRGSNPHERAHSTIERVSDWVARAKPPGLWALKHELGVAYCYVDRVEEARTIAHELLSEPLPAWLRGHVHLLLGWIQMVSDEPDLVQTLELAVEELESVGHISTAANAAQILAISITTGDEEERLARFDRVLELAQRAGDLRHFPRALLDRSLSTVIAGSDFPALPDARKAARLGPWSPSWMRAAFGSNYALCLAHAGDFAQARFVLDETANRLFDDDRVGHTQLRAMRCVVAAFEGNHESWATLTATQLETPVPAFFAFLSERAWNSHKRADLAEHANEFFVPSPMS